MDYVSLADMALHGGNRKRYGSFSPSLQCLYPPDGNFTLSSVLWGHPTAYDAFAALLPLLGIPQISPLCGHRRLSPVDIVALYSMNRSLTPPMQSRPRPIGHDCVAFHQIESVGHRVCLCFGVQYCPYCLTSHALRPMLPLSAQGLLLVAWLMPFQAGFPPACYAILCWAHQFQKLKVDGRSHFQHK